MCFGRATQTPGTVESAEGVSVGETRRESTRWQSAKRQWREVEPVVVLSRLAADVRVLSRGFADFAMISDGSSQFQSPLWQVTATQI